MFYQTWLIYSVILVVLGLVGHFNIRHVNTENQYLLAGRKTKLFALTATLVMTEFNTSTLIAFSSLGYSAKWRALLLPCVFLIGLIFYAMTVAKKWKTFNGTSVAFYFKERYGKDIGVIAAGILFLSMLGFSATYVKSLSLIFMPLFPAINPWILSGILSLIMIFMSYRGGLVAIIRMDIISFIIILIFFPIILFHASHLTPLNNLVNSLTSVKASSVLPIKFVASLIFLTMFSYILAPWYGQKIVSANTPNVAAQAVTWAALLVFILYGIGIAACSFLAISGVHLAHAEEALPYILKNSLTPFWQAVGYSVLFLTAMTTLTGVWNAMVTLIAGHATNSSNKKNINPYMIWMVICALISYLLANLFVDKIFDKMILANIPIVALSFSLLAGFYWKKANRTGAYLSIFTGLIWGLGCYLYFGEKSMYTWYWAIYGIPSIFVSGIIGSWLGSFFSNKKSLYGG
jgi:Na+/proline symporter